MASVTRSVWPAEGIDSCNQHRRRPRRRPDGPARALLHQPSSSRPKRGLAAPDRDLDVLKPKRAKYAAEILLSRASDGHDDDDDAAHDQAENDAPVRRSRLPTVATVTSPSSSNSSLQRRAAPQPASRQLRNPQPTKHKPKVSNGIKHELDRPQPPQNDTREYGRKLRSQEATRFKSELSSYFPEYDEVIGNDPKEQHILNLETPIVVVDSRSPRSALEAQPSPLWPIHRPSAAGGSTVAVRGYGDALFTDVLDSQRIDFGFLQAQYKNTTANDPLPDALFEPAHRRAERLERSIRNSEKGRAQHERDQIVRLLDGLLGHDWLRIMGVSGITESKKKSFEPARDHFIKGCRGILEKFRNWNTEEKRRKLEKERAVVEQAGMQEECGEQEVDEDGQDGGESDEDEENSSSSSRAEVNSQAATSDASSPAKQLQEEMLARSQLASQASKSSRSRKKRPPNSRSAQAKPPPAFTSFFGKKHERDGALSRHRRTGRKVLAWGHPIPDIPGADFVLPEAYRDDETMRSHARKRRRDRRGKK